MTKESRIYGLFGNDTYFNAAFLEKRLNEVLKIFTKGEANIRDRDGAPLTAAQLWEKYFANDPGILREYLSAQQKAATEEKAPKICAESEMAVNVDIFKPKQPKIEDIVGIAPNLQIVIPPLLTSLFEIY